MREREEREKRERGERERRERGEERERVSLGSVDKQVSESISSSQTKIIGHDFLRSYIKSDEL